MAHHQVTGQTIMRLSNLLFIGAIWAGLASATWAGNLQVNVIDKDGNPVADAVVVLQPSQPSSPKTPLAMQSTISQEKMRFAPAVTLVSPGAKIRFVNNDPWEHHVRTSAAGAAQFNASSSDGASLMIEGKADGKPAKSVEAVFDKPGAVLLGCHLHASMRGHIYVSDSPWAAITNSDGVATFEAAPDGAAQVRVWQADQLIDIAPLRIALGSAPVKTTLQLSVVPRRRRG
jgi:plastocyanin